MLLDLAAITKTSSSISFLATFELFISSSRHMMSLFVSSLFRFVVVSKYESIRCKLLFSFLTMGRFEDVVALEDENHVDEDDDADVLVELKNSSNFLLCAWDASFCDDFGLGGSGSDIFSNVPLHVA